MGILPFLPLILVSLLVLILLGVFYRLKRTSPSGEYPFVSHLVCPKCGSAFDYLWVPFITLTAIKLFDSRLFSCPVCGRSSIFNVWSTRVDPRSHRCPIQIGPL